MRNQSIYQLAVIAVGQSNIQTVANTIGYSRTALSLYMSGNYAAGVEKIEEAIKRFYDVKNCPFLTKPVDIHYCTTKSTAARPIKSGGVREAHWLACQSCPNKIGDKK
jgi:DNA transposition AAA+ family ATPase